MSTDLPVGWARATLDAVAGFVMGQAPPSAACNFDGKGVPFVKAGEFGAIRPLIREWTTAPLKTGARGDVFICVVGATAGKLNLGIDWAIGRSVAAIRPWNEIDPEFLLLQMKPMVPALRAGSTGSAQGVISREALATIPVVVPPLAEQKRIIAKVEELTARSRRAKEALDAVPPLLDQLRQSILAAACSGRFTSAAGRPGNTVPPNWHWSKLSELAMPDGIFDGARDHGEGTAAAQNLRASDYTDTGVRVIRLENLAPLSFIHEKTTYISEDKAAGLKPASVSAGDILFGSFIEGRVRVCVLPELGTPAIAKADCFCIRARRDVVHPEYLALQLACERTRLALREQIHGATRPRITTKQLREIRIPVCEMSEQQEIVNRVASFFASIGNTEESLGEMARDLVRLEQSLLAKAFRGELVSQDPRDEPASVVLDRIRVDRAKTGPGGASGSRRRSRNGEPPTDAPL